MSNPNLLTLCIGFFFLASNVLGAGFTIRRLVSRRRAGRGMLSSAKQDTSTTAPFNLGGAQALINERLKPLFDERGNKVSPHTQKGGGVLVEISFPSEEKAEQVRQKLLDMHKEYLIGLSDAVIAVKLPNGRIKLNQVFNPTADGAASGVFWGTLIGMIFMTPLDDVAGTAGTLGIDRRFMRDAGQSLQSSNAALFLLIRTKMTDKVLAALQGEGGTVIHTSFDETKEEALRTARAGAPPSAAESRALEK